LIQYSIKRSVGWLFSRRNRPRK